MRLLNLRISFYLLRTFCPHLGIFLCCFFFHYVKFFVLFLLSLREIFFVLFLLSLREIFCVVSSFITGTFCVVSSFTT